MNDEISNPRQPIAPVLTDRQRTVLESLRGKETEKYPLSQWYLGALYSLEVQNNPDRISQAAHSLRELVEKLPRVIQEMDMQGQYDFKGMRRALKERFSKDKKRYEEKWKDKKIDGRLDKTLRKVDDYLERNQQPPRREQIQTAIAKLDPMVDQLDSGIRQAKRDNLYELWRVLEGFTHHNSKPDINEFRKYLETLEGMIFDLLAPITAQDQNEIQSVLELSNRSESDEKRMLSLIERRGANFAFFFEKVSDASWIPVLRERGYFAQPLKAEVTEDGGVIFPFWWPVLYLERVSVTDPSLVVDTILGFQNTDNPRVLYTISAIALKIEQVEESLRLKDWVLKYSQFPYHFGVSDLIPKLMDRWAGASEKTTVIALKIMRNVVPFEPDPRSQEKQARRKENPKDWTTLLEPQPRFRDWEYQGILEKGVQPLAEREPYQAARILIDATANMIYLRFYRDQLGKIGDNDHSTIWCRRVNESAKEYRDSKENLVHALTFACEKVYEKAPEFVATLDETLRKQRWDIFLRIRQHLYAKFPGQTRHWIHDMILDHPDYSKWEHQFEFQRMIRFACEQFGADLLTEEERARIFEAILSGPSEQSFRDWLGDQFTKELFEERRRNFHKMQLNPFASVLFGEYRNYFQELTAEEEKPISDDDYAPHKSEGAKWIGRQSPKPTDELKKMPDKELLSFLNEWENVGHAPDDWWTEITFEALAEAFREIFPESIIADVSRLRFWIENKHRIGRPIYVRAMVSAIQEHVKLKQFDRLDDWFDLCEWILSHTDQPKEAGVNRSDESKAHPDWSSSRRAVGDFVDMCVKQEVDVPISARKRLYRLLDKLCTQYDEGLDESEPALLNLDDQLTEAINNPRSRALESLVDFAYWARRQLGDDQADVPEVFNILEKRIGPESDCPLTLPEYALLGMHYSRICGLNRGWAKQHRSDFFPQENLREWTEAFGNFLKYNRTHRMTFDILRDEIEFALEKIDELRIDSYGDLIDTLGEHLFAYYVWDVYPLKGENSLLERFYEKTTEDKERWSHLFDHVGRSLKNSGRQLEEDLRVRIIAFFDWRFEAKEPSELSMFTFWLAAECLDAEWRLKSYSKVLEVCGSDGIRTYTQLESLLEMLEGHTALVVECFAKLTDVAIKSGSNTYIHNIDHAKPILEAGLKSDDAAVKENAEHARENLLKGGHFEFLNLED